MPSLLWRKRNREKIRAYQRWYYRQHRKACIEYQIKRYRKGKRASKNNCAGCEWQGPKGCYLTSCQRKEKAG